MIIYNCKQGLNIFKSNNLDVKIMRQTTKWIIGAVIVIALIVVGYSIKGQSEPISAEPIKIGTTLALSGKFAYLGEAQVNGLRMAVEEINSDGGIRGKQLELIAEDNQGDAKQAVSNVSKLLNIDNADIILSAFTHITNAVKDVVEQKNKVMIYTSTVGDIAESSPLFFRDYYDAADNGRALAKLVRNSGYKNVSFLTEVSDQCLQLENAFKEESGKYGINVIRKESFNSTEKDLKTPLIKIKESNPEAIVVCAWRHEYILMKQLKELGMIETQTFHWVAPFLPVADTEDMRSLFEENNAVSTWYWFAEVDYNDKQREFFEKYQERYGVKPTGESVYAYDDIYILADALTKCDKKKQVRDSGCIAEELLKTDYNGVAGRLTFTEKGVSNRDITAITVKNGLWTEVPIE